MLIVEYIESGENVEDKKQKRGGEYKESGVCAGNKRAALHCSGKLVGRVKSTKQRWKR